MTYLLRGLVERRSRRMKAPGGVLAAALREPVPIQPARDVL